jgi:hypothetical protein
MSISAQVATLIGVALGGFLSFLTAAALERNRTRRDEANRWMTARLDSYITYLAAVKHVVRDAKILYSIDHEPSDNSSDRSAFVAELARFEMDRSVAFESVVLLGSQETLALGAQLNEAVWRMEIPARTGEQIDENEWRNRAAQWLAKLNEFQASARNDLRVGAKFDPSPLAGLPGPGAGHPLHGPDGHPNRD